MENENIDYAIICETWLDKVPTLIDSNYEVYQTIFSKHQGVWILARKGWTQRWYTNKEPYLIAIQTRNQGKEHFVIGVYLKEEIKEKILESLCKLIHRIRIKHLNPIITWYGDFNTNKKFNIETIEKKTELKAIKINKLTVTRTQTRKDEISNSTLDYFMSSQRIEEFKIMGKAGSDHLPMTISIHIKGKLIKKENIWITRRVIPKTEEIKKLLQNRDWPSTVDLDTTKKIWQKKLTIRPTIKIQECANQILKVNSWENAIIDLKAALSLNFQDYVKDLDLWRTKDSARFYRIVNSLLKYKIKGKIVKGIQEGDVVLLGKEKRDRIVWYFNEIYQSESGDYKIRNNGIFDFKIDIDRAIESIAKNKAVGHDLIPGELFKDKLMKEELKCRLGKHFRNYITTGVIPDYFMSSKLILLSKNYQEYTDINNIRPISVLPTITKLFETSIIHNLEKVTDSIIFNKNQRGFCKGKSTLNNIHDLMNAAKELQMKRKHDKSTTATIVFFDLTKAYDMANRDILLEKLQKYGISVNIVCVIKNMLDKFTLKFEGQVIKTQKGLVQGSVISPILFNLYINDLMWNLDLEI